jgi:RNA-directed DNA polymerase
MVEERRRPAVQQSEASTSNGRNKSQIAKPFRISKQEVVAAWERVRNNGGAAGVDKQTIGLFENDLKNNLYAVWNRMSSGSYFPEPVRRVEIPKGDGKLRPLGIPTVKDRIAQEIVRARLEVKLETVFDPDSYGFRPGRSALDAVGVCRKRCFEFKWVVDVDIEKFFDTIDHEKMMKAVRFHCGGEPEQKWMILYIERWLKAGVLKDGELQPTVRGTPQGGVISPLLANLYLHYAIDEWMNRTYPECPFERYADDGAPRTTNWGNPEVGAAREMGVGPPESLFRKRLQSTLCCCSKELWW